MKKIIAIPVFALSLFVIFSCNDNPNPHPEGFPSGRNAESGAAYADHDSVAPQTMESPATSSPTSKDQMVPEDYKKSAGPTPTK